MDRLTKEEIVAAWNSAVPESKDKGIEMYLHLMQAVADAQYRKCSLSLESERSEALPNVEEIPEYFAKPGITEGLANAHPTLLVRQMANEILRLRALSPARVAEGGWNERGIANIGTLPGETSPAPESPAKEQPGEQNAAPQEMVMRLRDAVQRASAVRDTLREDGRPHTANIIEDLCKSAEDAASLLAKLGQGWIPVSQRLPEEHVEVLAYHQWKHRSPKSVRASWYKHSDGTVCWVIETTTGHPDNVPPPSHWMPLPPPPERP